MINQRGEVEFAPRVDSRTCTLGRQFRQWTDGLLRRMGTTPSQPELARAKVLLTDRYFSFREASSAEHRGSSQTNHLCIYDTFVYGYEQIREIELMLPATLELYAGPAPVEPRQFNGLVLEDDCVSEDS